MPVPIQPHISAESTAGDPHIDPFDNGIFGRPKVDALGIYSSGDYWLVKNDQIKIQARYGTTIYTPSNMSALLSLAFSGSWLWNDTLIIEPEEGEITYAGSPILTTFPAEFSNRISRLRYVPGEEHIDGVLKNYPVKMIQALNSPSPATIESQNWGLMENLREPYIFGERPWFSFDFQLDPLIEWFSLPEDSRKSGHWPRFLRPSSPETCE